MSGANFLGAELYGADLAGANLNGARNLESFSAFESTRFCETTMPDGSMCNRDCEEGRLIQSAFLSNARKKILDKSCQWIEQGHHLPIGLGMFNRPFLETSPSGNPPSVPVR